MERLLKYFVPEKYILDLYVDKSKKTIGGEVKVLGKALEETIKFHAVDLEISDVEGISCLALVYHKLNAVCQVVLALGIIGLDLEQHFQQI